MQTIKRIKTAVYCLAGLIALAAVFLFWNLFLGSPMDLEDMGEFTGVALAVTMGFELLLFPAMQLLKHKLVPASIKKYFVWLTKYINQFHTCVGTLGTSILLLHVALTLDLSNPWKAERVTGYVVSSAIILSVFMGILSGPKRKAPKLLHMVFAIVAVVPFLLHIL